MSKDDERLNQLNEMYGLQFKSWDEIPRDDLIYHLRTLLLEYSILVTLGLGLSNRSKIEKEITGALKNTIDSHGPITLSNRHSAAKRIYCALRNLDKIKK